MDLLDACVDLRPLPIDASAEVRQLYFLSDTFDLENDALDIPFEKRKAPRLTLVVENV